MTRYYLDTSVQIERWFGAGSVRRMIAELLASSGEHSSSMHVLREWKRLVDQSAVEILNTLTSDQVADDLPRFVQGWGREPNRRLLVLFSLLRDIAEPTDEVRLRARQMLRFRSKAMFEGGLSRVRDGCDCGLAKQVGERSDEGVYHLQTTCRKSDRICDQEDFIEDRLEAWRAVAAALTATDTYRGMGRTADKMAGTKGERKGKNCYERTGDVSIGVDSAEGETILTTDSSFNVIGPAIGRDVRVIEGTKPPRRAVAPPA